MRQALQRREGMQGLSVDKAQQGPPGEDRSSGEVGKVGGSKRRGAADNVGKALRSAYDEALREDVPDDFLDLLGKLS